LSFQEGLESAWSNVATFVPKLPGALVILIAGLIVAKIVAGIVNKVLLGSVLSSVTYGRQLATGGGVAVMVLGVFAALDQLEIAQNIVNGLWYAILAVVAGSAVAAFGGGGIPVARRYLERAANKTGQRAPEVRDQVAGSDGERYAATRTQQIGEGRLGR
jgi:hypothetical protein